jgi:hypothetical protein
MWSNIALVGSLDMTEAREDAHEFEDRWDENNCEHRWEDEQHHRNKHFDGCFAGQFFRNMMAADA